MSLPFGVCLFDEPSHPTTGVAILDGEIRRVSAYSDLDSNAVWWTNIPYRPFKEGRLYELQNLRSEQLLRVRLPSLLNELGAEDLALPDQAELLYGVIRRTLTLAQELWDIDLAGMTRLDWELKKYLLPSGRRLIGELYGVLTAARDAHQYITPSMHDRQGNESTRSYLAPRLPYMKALLSLPYPNPKGKWELIKFDQPLRLNADNLPAPLSTDRAALLSINIRDLDPARAEFAPFTKKTGYGQNQRTRPRSWCTLPEALSYATDAEVTVRHAWVGELAPLRPDLALPGDDLSFSYSAGLLAEAFFFALSASTSSGSSTGLEPVAAYVTSYDRVYLTRLAREFYEEGYNPLSTGSMRLVMSIRPADQAGADRVASQLGLEPPMAQVRGDAPSPERSAAPVAANQA